ncbi:MAG: BMC domain-containing protein [Myxococcales bacterium]|nr:BMC domain-containing protein [Myxococcales bacterium]
MPDALALLELTSVSRGYRVLDWMVKEAPVTVVEANLVEPGKYLILFGGGVAETQASFDGGVLRAEGVILDRLLLPFAHPRIWACLAGQEDLRNPDCIGIVEGAAVSSVIEAADRSAKEAEVVLAGLRVTGGLGGKAYYVVTGTQNAVEAAVHCGRELLEQRGRLVDTQVIPRAHVEFLPWVLRRTPFGSP